MPLIHFKSEHNVRGKLLAMPAEEHRSFVVNENGITVTVAISIHSTFAESTTQDVSVELAGYLGEMHSDTSKWPGQLRDELYAILGALTAATRRARSGADWQRKDRPLRE